MGILQSIRDLPSVVSYHYKQKQLNYPMIIYISLVHIVAVVGALRVTSCSLETFLWSFLLWPIRYVVKVLASISKYNIIIIYLTPILLSNTQFVTVDLESPSEYTDFGLTDHMKHPSPSA